jgi:hypothetical protein
MPSYNVYHFRRGDTMENSKPNIWIAAALLVGFSVFPYLVWTVSAASKTEARAETKQVILEVQNMTCSL